jgi:hypothetical protein
MNMKKIILPLFLVIAVGATAQKVSSKLSFQSGQKLEVTTNMDMTTSSMLGESKGNVVNVEEYTVANASPSASTLQKAAKKIKLNFSLMGKDYTLDSDNKQDLEGQFGAPIKQILQQKFEFTVDANGKITNVKSDGKKADEGAGMLGMMMPGMNASAAVPVAGNPSAFKFLPDGREIGKGDTWIDSVSTADNQSKTTYTVKDITDAEILLDFVEEGKVKAKQAAMGMNLDVTSTSKSSGTITLDKATGILKQKTATTDTESNMSMGGQEMSSTMKMTAVTTVKSI